MTNDIRVLAKKRFEAGKDLHSPVPKNRHERRAAQRHAKLLEASRMRMVGPKSAPHVADSAKGEHKDTLRAELEAQEIHRTGRGRNVALAVVLELAVALACGGIVADEPDMDANQDADVAADVEQDSPDSEEADGSVEDVAPTEDAVETPDEVATEDAPPEVEEDGGAEDVEDTPDTVDAEDEGAVEDAPEAESSDGEEADAEEAEDSGTEADAPGCTPSVTIETGTPTSGPETVCGSTQVVTVSTEVTRMTGSPECEAIAPVNRMVGKRVMLSPYLDVSSLACARGAMTNALNGPELVVGLTPTDLDTAITLVPCQYLGVMGTLSGGGGEYSAMLNDVRSYLVLNVTPPSGSSRFINAYITGVAELWTHDRAYVAARINELALHATLCYVYFPITTRTGTSLEVWTAGDWGTFTWGILVVGPELRGWEWVRP